MSNQELVPFEDQNNTEEDAPVTPAALASILRSVYSRIRKPNNQQIQRVYSAEDIREAAKAIFLPEKPFYAGKRVVKDVTDSMFDDSPVEE